jgi:type IV pilus assembly protein PilW
MPVHDVSCPPRRARGLSLIELMVGLTIGLVLVTIVLRGFASTSGNASLNSLVSEYQTNGRYALEVLKREVRHASLSPLLWDATQLSVNPTAAAANFGCGVGVGTAVLEGLRASNDANPYAASCLADSTSRQYLRGDVLMLRRLGLEPTTTYAANAPFARVSYGSGNVFLGGETPAQLPPPVYDYPLVNEIYFVNSFTTSADESPRVPALYRLTFSGGPSTTPVPELVASNVEHMQWQFAIDDGTGGLRFVNPGAVTDWTTVASARVWLLLRASLPEAGLQSGSYTLGDVTYTPNDRFRRIVLSSTIQLRNQ